MLPVAMTVPEVALVLRLSTKTVYKLIRSGELPARRTANTYRIARGTIQQYLNRIG